MMTKQSFTLTVGNSSQKLQDNKYEWTCFVESSTANTINKVTFKLHPTFKVNTITVNQSPFQITRVGWGTFPIGIDIEFTDSKIQQLNWNLRFDKNSSVNVIHSVNIPDTKLQRNQLVSSNTQELSTDCIQTICSYLEYNDVVKLSLLNSHYYESTSEDPVWKEISNRWNVNSKYDESQSWKETFIRYVTHGQLYLINSVFWEDYSK
jgi:transcription initiation factor IIF auxiliary subunit